MANSHTQFLSETRTTFHNQLVAQPPQEKKLNLEEAMAHLASSHTQFMNETRKMTNMFSKRKGSLPSTYEVNLKG